MINKLKPAILFLIHFLFLQSTHGQVEMNMRDYLSEKFSSYCTAVPREEIFIQCDKEDYIAGEDLWFNVYLIDRQNSLPSLNSKIVYLELLDPENRTVVQKRILIDKGFGPGKILLPAALNSGRYTIRAYTNWMKNFLPHNCFMKDIRIYNAFSTIAFKEKLSSGSSPDEVTGTEIIQRTVNAGLTLTLNNQKPDILEIFVTADEGYRSDNNNLFNLFIQTHGIIDRVSTERIPEENTKITISKSLLTAGINHITIFDSRGLPICERFIFTPDKVNQSLMLHTLNRYNIRSKISLEIEVRDEISTALKTANLSISVAPVTNNPEIRDLNDYLVFGSEYGLMPWSTIKGRKINELPPEVIDSILLTVSSNWINWRTILSEDPPLIKFQPEKDDHFLLGKLLTADEQPADSGELLLLSIPGKEAVFQYARTENEGIFSFKIPIDDQIMDLIIQPDDISQHHKINIGSSISDQYLSAGFMVDSTNDVISTAISKQIVNYQVRKIYESTSVGENVPAIIRLQKQHAFYGKPDISLIMADYIKLPVMQEVFFELIPGVFLKNKKSVYEVSIVDPVTNKIYNVPPVLMIDGVVIRDPSIIANLDPELVEKIDVEKEKYFIGDYLFYGILNVITKSGDYSSVSLPDYATRIPYKAVDQVSSFVSPDYASPAMKNSRLPDFRNTLYWNPLVKTDRDGKAIIEFWSSDLVSEYEINIQGITSEGRAVSLKKIIKVE